VTEKFQAETTCRDKSACCFSARIHGREFYSTAAKFLQLEIQEVRDLQGFLVIDCNGYMKFFPAHCGRR
jgi:hypothetical protein